jgi:uncharacterized membrane protein
LSIFVPDVKDISIPLAIKIYPKSDDEIVVNKDFSVTGVADFSYFIPQSHYNKWRFSYLLIYMVILLAILSVDILFICLAIRVDGFPRLVMVGILVILMLFSFLLIRKLYAQLILKKKYSMGALFG